MIANLPAVWLCNVKFDYCDYISNYYQIWMKKKRKNFPKIDIFFCLSWPQNVSLVELSLRNIFFLLFLGTSVHITTIQQEYKSLALKKITSNKNTH